MYPNSAIFHRLAGAGCRMENKMRDYVKSLIQDESGAVTVDWVVLSAAVIGIGMIVLFPIAFSSESVAVSMSEKIADRAVGYTSN
jgi:hypothetical protein